MGDDKILRQNKIPGCDELTRPEEIKALSKFLRHIKDVQSEHTKLQKDNLEIPGRTTGKIPKISKLPNSSQTLDVRKARIDKLEGNSINIPTNENESGKIKLPNYREKLSDQRKVELSEYVEGLDDNRNPELSKYKENIEDNRTNRLSDHIEGLDDNRKQELSEYRENITDNRKNSLSNYKEELNDQRKQELSNYREDIEDKRTNELSDYRENIEDTRTNNLSNYRENLQDNRTNQLSNYKEKISDSRINQLETYKEQLEDNRDIQLSEYKQTITDGRNISLSNYKESITDPRENELSNHKENLVDDRETELSNYKEELHDNRIQELSTYKETITDPRDTTLSEYKESITDDRDISLSDKKESIVDSRNIELNTYKEKIADDRTTELSDYKGELIVSEENTLSNYIENLEVTQENELSDYQEPLIPSSNSDSTITELENGAESIPGTITEQEQLEDFREPLTESTNPESTIEELENYREELVDSTNENSTVIELENERLDIVDSRDNELEDYREELTDSTNSNSEVTALEDERLDLVDNRTNELEDYQEKLTSSTNSESTVEELEDTRLDLTDNRENSLEDERIDLIDERENNLEDTRIDITDDRASELENTRLDLEDDRENTLESFIDELDDDRENNLEDGRLNLTDDRTNELEDERVNLGGEITDPELYDESDRLNTPDASNSDTYFDSTQEGNELYDAVLERPNSSNEGWFDPEVGGDLYDAVLERPENKQGEVESLSDLKVERPNNIKAEVESLVNSNKELPSATEADVYNQLIKLLGNMGNWGQKMSSLLSSYYLAVERDDKKLAEEYDSRLRSELQLQLTLSKLQVPENNNPKNKNSSTNSSDINNSTDVDNLYGSETIKKYTDYGSPLSFRDGLLGKISLPGALRSSALNTAIQVINRVANFFGVKVFDNLVNARLPGLDDDWKDMAKDAVTGAVKSLANTMSSVPVLGNVLGDVATCMERPDPVNVPSGMPAAWTPANNRTTTSGNTTGSSSNSSVKEKGSFLDQAKDAVIDMGVDALASALGIGSYSFKVNYLTGKGIGLTLSDLCLNDVSKINTVDDLYNALRKSPFMTVPDKFTTTGNNGYVVTTLDSNSHWEIILEPYCGIENGFTSYLPAIHEINTRNIALHSVNTGYNRWIPFTSFDLQKSKLNTKSVSLYDGEFYFPVSMEYTNELRLTIVDDQYKSWRTYFETCADAAIYNSEPHTSDYYSTGSGSLTTIDKSCVLVSSYKNICFRCVIYVMTPQLSTIKKYSLLLVMKDFTEESVGEIDSGGSDLTISFSIVGENPNGEVTATQLNTEKIEKKDSGGGILSTVLDSGVTSAIGLL